MPGPTQGTGYTNLSSIINANQGNQLGQSLQQGVQKGISGLQSNITQSQNQFNTDVNNANLNTQANQQNVTNAINAIVPQAQTAPQQVTSSAGAPVNNNQQQTSTPSSGGTASPAPSSASSSPATATSNATGSSYNQTPNAAPASAAPGSFGTSTAGSGTNTTQNTYAPTAGTMAQIGQYLQGGYSGPTQLNNLSALQAQAQNLQQQGQQVNTQGGLQSLLQQYIGGPQYTQGEQNLDTLILGQTGKGNLQNILNATQGLNNLPQAAAAQAATQASQTAAGNQQFAQNVQNQLAAAQTPVLQQIQNQINSQNTANQTQENIASNIYSLLNGGTGNAFVGGATPGGMVGPIINAGAGLGAGTNAGTPTGNLANADLAVQLLGQSGLLPNQGGTNPTPTAQNLEAFLNTQSQAGQNPLTLLNQAFSGYIPGAPAPSYTLQQGATAQQAAQLNALQQLAGQTQTYGTYGGMNPYTPTFNINNVTGYNPNTNYSPEVDYTTPAPATTASNEPSYMSPEGYGPATSNNDSTDWWGGG